MSWIGKGTHKSWWPAKCLRGSRYNIRAKIETRNCENYRGIPFLNITYILVIIYNRLNDKIGKIVGDYEADFRKKRRVVDKMFVLKKDTSRNHQHRIIFFKQAYDELKWLELYKSLTQLDIQSKIIGMVRMTL